MIEIDSQARFGGLNGGVGVIPRGSPGLFSMRVEEVESRGKLNMNAEYSTW